MPLDPWRCSIYCLAVGLLVAGEEYSDCRALVCVAFSVPVSAPGGGGGRRVVVQFLPSGDSTLSLEGTAICFHKWVHHFLVLTARSSSFPHHCQYLTLSSFFFFMVLDKRYSSKWEVVSHCRFHLFHEHTPKSLWKLILVQTIFKICAYEKSSKVHGKCIL